MTTNQPPQLARASLGRRLLWFVGIYIVSVMVFAVTAFLLELLLPR